MQGVYNNPGDLEKKTKDFFSIPPFLMMENAARTMADFILSKNAKSVLIICGKGNNGGDGYALARLLLNKVQITVISWEDPAAQEASLQYEMCRKLGIKIVDKNYSNLEADIIVDCLYGIGFHGELDSDIRKLFDKLNSLKSLRIACDIPSGLYFNADFTITMGELKTALYSDKAKSVCGQIIVSELGIPRENFEQALPPDAFLIEERDMKLPLRNNPSAHKGTYGHTVIFAGEKSGAGIISATAAMNFGSGLTTLLKTKHSNLEQFKISPELMISEVLPAKTSCIVVGPGLGTDSESILNIVNILKNWGDSAEKPCIVFDADMMTWNGLPDLLQELNKIENIKIILTPHLSELSRFIKDIDVKTLADEPEKKLELAAKLNQLYPRTTVIMKSANTFIASEGKVFICADGVQSLAKGGSGDVLAGMAGALLAQGYSAKDAAITAVETHALAAKKAGAANYAMTPEKLIEAISTFVL